MFEPQHAGDQVMTPDGLGTWTGETGPFGEHYVIDLGSTKKKFHYEDLSEV